MPELKGCCFCFCTLFTDEVSAFLNESEEVLGSVSSFPTVLLSCRLLNQPNTLICAASDVFLNGNV